ncbi:MAG: L,D-transpeptidase family protein [Myxococcota bacterium]
MRRASSVAVSLARFVAVFVPVAVALAALALPVGRVRAAEPTACAATFTAPSGLTPAGEAVRRWVERAPLHGVDVALDPAALAPRAPGDAAARAAAEQAWADALERLVAELPARPRQVPILQELPAHHYLSPDVLWRDAPPPVAAPEAVAAACSAAAEGQLDAWLAARLPAHPQYARLVAAAEAYAAVCAPGEWAPVVLPKDAKAFDGPEVATAIQARLAREGFYAGQPTGAWDDAARAAVAAYRAARQLPPAKTGVVDADLVAALNVPCRDRLAQIELNARRWRVSAWRGEATSVQVNLAAQELRYFRDGALAMTQRTVVGSTKYWFDPKRRQKVFIQSTPILADSISRIILNPEWAVPARIARNELDAEVVKDPDYVAKHHFRLVDGPTGKTYIQASGPWNALGQIKILFPNEESVYLHDTPGKKAFDLTVRALSHGCVRVQNAVDFGFALLAGDAATGGAPFDEAAMRERLKWVGGYVIDLKTEVPVFLEYYTVSVGEDGALRFHPDIYGYDAESLPRLVR